MFFVYRRKLLKTLDTMIGDVIDTFREDTPVVNQEFVGKVTRSHIRIVDVNKVFSGYVIFAAQCMLN